MCQRGLGLPLGLSSCIHLLVCSEQSQSVTKRSTDIMVDECCLGKEWYLQVTGSDWEGVLEQPPCRFDCCLTSEAETGGTGTLGFA